MKKLILGLVIGLILGMSTNAFAAISNGVEAVFASFNYTVNGEKSEQDVTVLVYNGSSYLKTTEVGGMLGYQVTYEIDSRTIEFTKPDPTPQPVTPTPNEPEVTPTASPIPIPLPTDSEGNVIPTPTLDPNATPEPSVEPTATPGATIEPTPTPTISPTPSPTPKPDNTAHCKAIRDDYGYQIGMLPYAEKNDLGHQLYYKQQLEYARDKELSAAGC